jgi:hypothetical protein
MQLYKFCSSKIQSFVGFVVVLTSFPWTRRKLNCVGTSVFVGVRVSSCVMKSKTNDVGGQKVDSFSFRFEEAEKLTTNCV